MTALALPTTERAGQPAGFFANWVSGQASWSVSRREGSDFGSCSSTLWMCASPGRCSRRTEKLVPFSFVKFPAAVAENLGPKVSDPHELAVKGALGALPAGLRRL